eukprot:g36897.t1
MVRESVLRRAVSAEVCGGRSCSTPASLRRWPWALSATVSLVLERVLKAVVRIMTVCKLRKNRSDSCCRSRILEFCVADFRKTLELFASKGRLMPSSPELGATQAPSLTDDVSELAKDVGLELVPDPDLEQVATESGEVGSVSLESDKAKGESLSSEGNTTEVDDSSNTEANSNSKKRPPAISAKRSDSDRQNSSTSPPGKPPSRPNSAINISKANDSPTKIKRSESPTKMKSGPGPRSSSGNADISPTKTKAGQRRASSPSNDINNNFAAVGKRLKLKKSNSVDFKTDPPKGAKKGAFKLKSGEASPRKIVAKNTIEKDNSPGRTKTDKDKTAPSALSSHKKRLLSGNLSRERLSDPVLLQHKLHQKQTVDNTQADTLILSNQEDPNAAPSSDHSKSPISSPENNSPSPTKSQPDSPVSSHESPIKRRAVASDGKEMADAVGANSTMDAMMARLLDFYETHSPKELKPGFIEQVCLAYEGDEEALWKNLASVHGMEKVRPYMYHATHEHREQEILAHAAKVEAKRHSSSEMVSELQRANGALLAAVEAKKKNASPVASPRQPLPSQSSPQQTKAKFPQTPPKAPAADGSSKSRDSLPHPVEELMQLIKGSPDVMKDLRRRLDEYDAQRSSQASQGAAAGPHAVGNLPETKDKSSQKSRGRSGNFFARLMGKKNAGGKTGAAVAPSPPVVLPQSLVDDKSFRGRLSKFYQIHSPGELDRVDEMCETYKQDETPFWEAQAKKFGKEVVKSYEKPPPPGVSPVDDLMALIQGSPEIMEELRTALTSAEAAANKEQQENGGLISRVKESLSLRRRGSSPRTSSPTGVSPNKRKSSTPKYFPTKVSPFPPAAGSKGEQEEEKKQGVIEDGTETPEQKKPELRLDVPASQMTVDASPAATKDFLNPPFAISKGVDVDSSNRSLPGSTGPKIVNVFKRKRPDSKSKAVRAINPDEQLEGGEGTDTADATHTQMLSPTYKSASTAALFKRLQIRRKNKINAVAPMIMVTQSIDHAVEKKQDASNTHVDEKNKQMSFLRHPSDDRASRQAVSFEEGTFDASDNKYGQHVGPMLPRRSFDDMLQKTPRREEYRRGSKGSPIGTSAIWAACTDDNATELAQLIKSKADIHAQTKDGRSLLYVAARSNSKNCLKLLIEAQCDIDVSTIMGKTAVCAASFYGNAECLRLLIEAGADVNKPRNDGSTPVFMTALKGQLQCLDLLIDAKADIHAANIHGHSPMFLAGMFGQAKVVERLVVAGGAQDINKADVTGWTALAAALVCNQKEAGLALIKFGAHPKFIPPQLGKPTPFNEMPLLTKEGINTLLKWQEEARFAEIRAAINAAKANFAKENLEKALAGVASLGVSSDCGCECHKQQQAARRRKKTKTTAFCDDFQQIWYVGLKRPRFTMIFRKIAAKYYGENGRFFVLCTKTATFVLSAFSSQFD